jgi:hypothetical protein
MLVLTLTNSRTRRTGMPGLNSFGGGVVEGKGETGKLANGCYGPKVDERPAVIALQQHDVAGLDIPVAVPAAVQILQPHCDMRQHLYQPPPPSPCSSRIAS